MRIGNVGGSLILLALLGTTGTVATAVGPAALEKVKPVIPIAARPFAPGDVKLLGGPFKHGEDLDHKYLLELDPDRLLAPYYEASGVPPTKPRYGGWEAQRNFIAGQMLGHWLSASTRMVKLTGDDELRKRVDHVVSELATLQSRNPNAYLGPFPERTFTTIFSGAFTVVEDRIAAQRVPWFTIDTLFAGLIDAYEIGGNKQALEVVSRLADWAKAGTDALSEDDFERMLGVEQGGMCESLAELYAITGEKKYFDLARRFTHHQVLDRLRDEQDDLNAKSVNAQIPKLIGAGRVYELSGDDYYEKAAHYFWTISADKRSYSFGGIGSNALFTELGKMPLGPATAETCTTFHMLRLAEELMLWKEEPRYIEYYERALYNHILGSQDPDTGMVTYFMSTKPGHFKSYSTPLESMWCCVGAGLENAARYTEAVYSHGDDVLWVNLYMPTELHWEAKGLTLRQETDFPEATSSKFTITAAPQGALAIHLRVPAWAAGPVVAKVNGTEAARAQAGAGWIKLSRTWARGDTIEVALPMNLHLYRTEGDDLNVSIMYGPLVLAAEMGRDRFPPDDHVREPGQNNSLPGLLSLAVISDKDDPAAWMKAVENKPVTFKTATVVKPADYELVPFYRVHHQRYSVYFGLMNAEQYAQRETAEREMARRTIDQVNPGQQQSEIEHRQSGTITTRGNFNGRDWRDAFNGGFFSYQMKVAPDAPNTLRVTYWGGEGVARDFDIVINGTKIADQQLNMNKPGEFFDVDYEIPEELTKGKNTVEVKFQGKPGATAGGAFGLIMLKR